MSNSYRLEFSKNSKIYKPCDMDIDVYVDGENPSTNILYIEILNDEIGIVFNDYITMEDSHTTISLHINQDNFLKLPNGKNKFIIRIVDCDNGRQEKIERYIEKDSNKMEIITNPIEIETSECAVDLNLNFKYLHEDTKVQVYSTNNGFDENKIWVDVSDHVLRGRNFILTNKIKESETWGLSFKIIIEGEFELDETFIGGYIKRGDEINPNKELNNNGVYVLRNTPWGNKIKEEYKEKIDEIIDILKIYRSLFKNQRSIDINIDEFMDLYNRGLIEDTQLKSLKELL